MPLNRIQLVYYEYKCMIEKNIVMIVLNRHSRPILYHPIQWSPCFFNTRLLSGIFKSLTYQFLVKKIEQRYDGGHIPIVKDLIHIMLVEVRMIFCHDIST